MRKISLDSAIPDVRFIKVSTKEIKYEEAREGTGVVNPKVTTIKIDATPSHDYYQALNLLLDFVIDSGDLGSKWTAGDVDSLKTDWTWNDSIDEWTYSFTVTVRKPVQDDDPICLICSFTLPKVSSKDLDNDVVQSLQAIWNEAWAYQNGKFDTGIQLQLVPPQLEAA